MERLVYLFFGGTYRHCLFLSLVQFLNVECFVIRRIVVFGTICLQRLVPTITLTIIASANKSDHSITYIPPVFYSLSAKALFLQIQKFKNLHIDNDLNRCKCGTSSPVSTYSDFFFCYVKFIRSTYTQTHDMI